MNVVVRKRLKLRLALALAITIRKGLSLDKSLFGILAQTLRGLSLKMKAKIVEVNNSYSIP